MTHACIKDNIEVLISVSLFLKQFIFVCVFVFYKKNVSSVVSKQCMRKLNKQNKKQESVVCALYHHKNPGLACHKQDGEGYKSLFYFALSELALSNALGLLMLVPF